MIPIFIISLSKSNLRRKFQQKQFELNNIPFVFFNAVDVPDVNENVFKIKFRRKTIESNVKRFNLGTIACTISHYKLFEYIVSNNIPKACILEDDIVINKDFKRVLIESDNLNIDSQSIILLDYKSHTTRELFVQKSVFKNYKLVKFNNIDKNLYSASGYIITLDVCKLYLNQTFIKDTIDSWYLFNDLAVIYGIFPFVISNAGFKSTINIHQPKKNKKYHLFIFWIENNCFIINYLLRQLRILSIKKKYKFKIYKTD